MGIEFESVVDHPLDEVFAWHTHPGAMRRLVPPWRPMTAVAETKSLADGDRHAPGGTTGWRRPCRAPRTWSGRRPRRRWLSWIGLDDLIDVYYRAIYDERLSGPVNAVAPTPVRNGEYTKTLAHMLRRPAALGVPSLGPRRHADQRVVPVKLRVLDHRFRQPLLEDALRHQLGHG
jgi:hypothetical protein